MQELLNYKHELETMAEEQTKAIERKNVRLT